jgi:methionyl-tRNA formyltransferase
MRIVLCGQRSFGRAILSRLHMGWRNEHDVVRVFAPPPGPDGKEDALAGYALVHGFDIREKASGDAVPECDLIVCAHSHTFLSDKALRQSRYGAIGYHPSLLPRHRGRDAVKWTIHMGDPVAGGSVYWFTGKVDGGPLAAQDYCLVRPGMTASELWSEHLFGMGVRLLLKVIGDVSRGTIVREAQDERCATWEPSWDRPPLERPDLIQLPAPGRHDNVRYVTSMREG